MKIYGIDVFIMVEANNEDEAIGIVEKDNLILDIMKVSEVDVCVK